MPAKAKNRLLYGYTLRHKSSKRLKVLTVKENGVSESTNTFKSQSNPQRKEVKVNKTSVVISDANQMPANVFKQNITLANFHHCGSPHTKTHAHTEKIL